RAPEDPRNRLLREFARVVGELRPKYFVLENVSGLLERGRREIDDLVNATSASGYNVVRPIRALDAAGYGVPQRRGRVFVLGYRVGCAPPPYPEPRPEPRIEPTGPTVWDAIGDLPNVDEFDELMRSDVFVGSLGLPSPYAAALRGHSRRGTTESQCVES